MRTGWSSPQSHKTVSIVETLKGSVEWTRGPTLTSNRGGLIQVKNFAVIYLVDITEVPDFNKMYELYDPSTVMFFFRNKHIMIDLGTGNNNKINWAMEDKQEMIDIIETLYRGARKGRGLVVSPKDYSTKYRY
ncbi:PREDICTED: thioredoxin-like protein 4A isoform X2 [Gekko japonicus]|uniref:Thioredoxin-like protein 4A isoform X2 n=1 Tax=Gekko japonicus TaxID=146911 RepID=A0ABM1K812_GEKJA|nr:PREDICTED: thioredoxin-like protein 4A isoform X2 [Gekko japonicus]